MEAAKQRKTKMDERKSIIWKKKTSPGSTVAPSVPQSFTPILSLPHFQEVGKPAPTEPTTENTISDPSKPSANQINTHRLGQGICGTWKVTGKTKERLLEDLFS